jgi:hypothetical protein
MRNVLFSSHAEMKFEILASHGRKVAQKAFDESHVLRVVFTEIPEGFRVITFYPGRRERYEAEI